MKKTCQISEFLHWLSFHLVKNFTGIKKLLFLLFITILTTLMTSRCYYESEEHLFPSLNACDTTNVTYAGTIVPILSSNCYTCHSNNTYTISGFNYQDTTVLLAQVRSGQIYRSITYQSHPMPPSSPISSCQIQVIKKWIDSGASTK